MRRCVRHASARAQVVRVEHSEGGKTARKLPTQIPSFSEYMQQQSQSQFDVAGSNLRGRFHVETYGCQMNVSDSEIVRSIMQGAGYSWTNTVADADIVFANTCAIRDKAEERVWGRLSQLKKENDKRPRKKRQTVGVLGCMAERLKTKLLEKDQLVDIVVGPDAYRDLPRLLQLVRGDESEETNSVKQHNEQTKDVDMVERASVQLSVEETYADIAPVRQNQDSIAAYISVMRGCNNMCAFCVVPFTRGRERSRPIDSILEEARTLSGEGVKEITLLGQNVNSYHNKLRQNDSDATSATMAAFDRNYQPSSEGFRNMFMSRSQEGIRFAELLHRVSEVDPEMRVRFTSPHPKDFPMELLQVIAERPNVCSNLHMPAQSGSTSCLERMRRGYGREAYIELVEEVRRAIPLVSLSSDFISGFCGETEAEHEDTLALLRDVRFDFAFMFAYSLEEIKKRRLQEVIETFRTTLEAKNLEEESGRLHVVLVEGESRRSKKARKEAALARADSSKTKKGWEKMKSGAKMTRLDLPQNVSDDSDDSDSEWLDVGTLRQLQGRTDTNKRVVFADVPVPTHVDPLMRLQLGCYGVGAGWAAAPAAASLPAPAFSPNVEQLPSVSGSLVPLQPGDYAVVQVTGAGSQTLHCTPIARTTLVEAAAAGFL